MHSGRLSSLVLGRAREYLISCRERQGKLLFGVKGPGEAFPRAKAHPCSGDPRGNMQDSGRGAYCVKKKTHRKVWMRQK